MKKFFTLFMATVLAVSMSALPQANKLAGKQLLPANEKQVTNPAKTKALEVSKTNMLQRDSQRPQSIKNQITNAPVKQFAATEGQTINVNFDDIAVGPEYYAEWGDWYIALSSDEWTVKLDWYAPEGENKDGYLGTFTTEDFELSYTYIIDPDWVGIDVKDITMTITKTPVSDAVAKIALNATILGTDGNTYVITAAKEVFTPKETIATSILDASFVWDGWLATLKAKNDDLDLNIDFYASWPTGPFSMIDLEMETTKVLYKGVALDIKELNMLVKATKSDAGQIGYEVELSLISSEPIKYDVYIFAPLAPATDTVNVEVQNMVVDESMVYDWGWIIMTSVTEQWDIYAGVYDFELTEATYASDENVIFYITNLETDEFGEQIYAEATVVNDPELGWVVYIASHCTDGKFYNVKMYNTIPTPTDTVTLRFEKPATAAFYPQYGNDLILAHNENNCYLSLDIVGLELGDSFTMDDLDMDYSMLYIDLANYTMVDFADVQGTLNQYGDTTVLKAEIIGRDSILYDVLMWHVAPTPTKTVELNIQAEFVNKLNTEGYYLVGGYSEDKQYFVCLSPQGQEIEGTFVNDGLFGKFGAEGGQYDFNSDYCYIYTNANTDNPVGVTIVKGQFEVKVEENGAMIVTASVIGDDAVQYNVTMTTEYNNHLQYDATEGAIDRTFTAEDEVIIETYEGAVYFEVMAADGSDICALYFFPEELDEDIVIGVGEYTIDASEEYNTVYASPGVIGYSVSPSFYGYMTEDGQGLASPLYFMVSGKVQVAKTEDNQLYIEVNAFNSYNVPIHIVYDPTETGLENVEVENVVGVKKMMVDGQLFIIRNGEAFNATGARVK